MSSNSMSLLDRLYIKAFVVELWNNLREKLQRLKWQSKRGFGRANQQIINNYFQQNEVAKLQIGAGTNLREGWLNTNYFPWQKNVLHLNAAQPFPFADHSFDYSFSEHMIEHIDYNEGLVMLAECFRVLKPGGRIRLSTPDFQFLVALYTQNHNPIQQKYTQWMTDWMTERKADSAPYTDPIFIINNFVRDWGHQFIYDEKSLGFSLEKVGFSSVIRCELQQSEDTVLANLENEQRYPADFLRLETLTMEAVKD